MTDIVFAAYEPNTGTVLARVQPRAFASAQTAFVRARVRPTAHAVGGTRLSGTVSAQRPRRSVRATANASTVFARRPARKLTSSGVELTAGHVSATAPKPRALATAVSAFVFATRPARTAAAFNTASPAPSGFVSALAPRAVGAATGHEITNATVAAVVQPRLLARAAANFVQATRPQRTAFARDYAAGARTGALQPNYPIFAGAVGTSWPNVSEHVAIGDELTAQVVYGLMEHVRLADGPSTLLDALAVLGDRVTFGALAAVAYRVLLAETVAVGDTATAGLRYALQLSDALALTAGVGTQLDAQAAVATALAFGDSLARLLPVTLADGLSLTGAAAATVRAMLRLMDAIRVQDTVTPGLVLLAQAADTVQFDDTTASTATLKALLADGIELLGTLTLNDGAYLAWVVNAETRAPVKYRNFPFNSFAKVGNRYFGAAPDGIYALEGDDDAGEPIHAVLRGGLADFGSSLLKRMPTAYVGYRADDALVLKVTQFADDGNGETHREEHWYRMEPRTGAIRENRVKLGRGLKSTYFGWELVNVDGADFALDTFAWYPLVLERRIN